MLRLRCARGILVVLTMMMWMVVSKSPYHSQTGEQESHCSSARWLMPSLRDDRWTVVSEDSMIQVCQATPSKSGATSKSLYQSTISARGFQLGCSNSSNARRRGCQRSSARPQATPRPEMLPTSQSAKPSSRPDESKAEVRPRRQPSLAKTHPGSLALGMIRAVELRKCREIRSRTQL